jgi:erythromycin esterase-like protein
MQTSSLSAIEFQLEAEQLLNKVVHSLDENTDLEPLIHMIGNARIVMLGEATHGTHEFYTWRSQVTKRLIRQKGFNFIAVEGDWPDCYSINRFIKGYDNRTALDILKQFRRWPTWMWANWEVLALAEWLVQHNSALTPRQKIGFYGLDVYSLWESFDQIRHYLQKVDPAALRVAEKAFRCFEPYKEDEGRSYAYATQIVPKACEDEVISMLKKIQDRMISYDHDFENAFSTEQNAIVAVNAEKYYRSMLQGGSTSWNIRDAHMEETLERLLKFHGPHSRAIIWAHNTHVGDARYTDMHDEGMFNIGELARKAFPGEVVLVGFGSASGSVVAGRSWGAPMQKMNLPQAAEGSWEDILHKTRHENKLVISSEIMHPLFLENQIGHRAVGVVYNPSFEHRGNYVPSILPLRYDAFVHIDETMALHEIPVQADQHEVPETFPFGV